MSYIVKLTTSFKKAYKKLSKKYRSLESDVDALAAQLSENPYTGADLGGGVRKVCMEAMAVCSRAPGRAGGIVLRCGTGRPARRNGPFGNAKRPILPTAWLPMD